MRLVLLLVVLVLAPSCSTAPWRERPAPWTPATLEGVEDARVTFADGIVLVLEAPHWLAGSEQSVIEGCVAGDVWRVPLAEVHVLETRRTEVARVVANTVVVVAVVAAVVAICICTGACPDLGGLSFSGPSEEDGARSAVGASTETGDGEPGGPRRLP